MVRRIENGEPIMFDLQERHDDAEDHGVRVVHFYIGDDDDDDGDDDEPKKEDCETVEIEPKVRRLGRKEMMWPPFLTVEQV